MPTLSQVSVEHRDRLSAHVALLPVIADEIGDAPWVEVGPRISAEQDFLESTLLPHMQSVEEAVHTELDRLLSCRLAMEPLEREHVEIRRLVARLGEIVQSLGSAEPGPGLVVELRRVVVRLYAILSVHLREEAMYLPMLEHNISVEQAQAIAGAMEHAASVAL